MAIESDTTPTLVAGEGKPEDPAEHPSVQALRERFPDAVERIRPDAVGTPVVYVSHHRNFEVLETYEAGIELFGHEVKSLRKGQGSLEGASEAVIPRGTFYV